MTARGPYDVVQHIRPTRQRRLTRALTRAAAVLGLLLIGWVVFGGAVFLLIALGA